MVRNQRRRFFIDRKVQGVLLRRAVVYWLLFVISLAMLSACWIALTAWPLTAVEMLQRMWAGFGPAFLASGLLLPIVLLDSVRLSNRFAGPIYRLRSVMRNALAGNQIDPIKLRDGDYWKDLADDFNRLVQKQRMVDTDR